MRKKTLISIFLILISLVFLFSANTNVVFADTLSDSIYEQLSNIDLSEFEDFLNSISSKPDDLNFIDNVYSILKGEYDLNYTTVLNYALNLFANNIYKVLPILTGIIAIAILSSIIHNVKSNFMSQGVSDIIFFVCLLGIILLLSSQLIQIFSESKNLIEKLAKLSQIMSPIILTLMVASGGNVSASVYKPAVAFLSGGVINIILAVVLPLIALTTIFSVMSNFSTAIKLNKLAECSNSIFKWIIGLIVTIFGLFLSIQGITSASFDGISIRATKFAISNSIPIIGGFLKDGFDLVVAGSVLIKNAVGVVSVFALFYIILSPVLYMATFSLLLKLVAGIIEPFGDNRICGLCTVASKTITYLTTAILIVGLMIFITILLMIFSANALI